jgi:putative ABC transport system substrate-binding protein
MRRREFITLLGGAAAAWPLAAHAQRPMPVIGFLGSETPDVFAARVRAFRQGLGETGYVEGRNVALVFQWAGGNYDLLPTLASELVRQRVSVLVTGGTTVAARAALAVTTTIPIVFYVGSDPVTLGLVASLARPGGNMTGVTPLATELLPKRLELLHEIVPAAGSVAILVNPNSANNSAFASQIQMMQNSAQALGLALHILQATTAREFDAIFLKVIELRAGGLIISPDPLFGGRDEQLGALSLHHRVPAIGINRDFVAAGGLMSYGGSLTDMFRVVGVYAGRILKGEKAAELPVQQATKVELTVNMKTARALGLTVPLTVLGRADEVIE